MSVELLIFNTTAKLNLSLKNKTQKIMASKGMQMCNWKIIHYTANIIA